MAKVRLNKKSAAFLVALVPVWFVFEFLSAERITLLVEDKSGRVGRSGTFINIGTSDRARRGKFLIYTPGEVFEVSSSYVFMKFTSAERYHSLKPGQSYNVIVSGWRIPVLGMYRNIIEVFPDPA